MGQQEAQRGDTGFRIRQIWGLISVLPLNHSLSSWASGLPSWASNSSVNGDQKTWFLGYYEDEGEWGLQGHLHTIDAEKTVFCIPSSLENIKGKATNELIQKGSKLVTNVEDIINNYPDSTRVQTGLNEAYIIYEIPIEGGMSRHHFGNRLRN